MASLEQLAISTALGTIIPAPDLRLVGYALIAEWQQPDGQRLLTRLIGDGGNPWQAKGYFYDGLSNKWPMIDEVETHHNPGHPSGWHTIS